MKMKLVKMYNLGLIIYTIELECILKVCLGGGLRSPSSAIYRSFRAISVYLTKPCVILVSSG